MVFVSDAGEGLTNGYATYKVVIKDESHVSREAEATAYIGLDYPTETEYMEITAEGNQVTIAWVPVTRGANGGYVGAKYNVYSCSGAYRRDVKLNDEPLTECVFTFEYDVESGEQSEAWFCVTAVNDIDESYGAYESIAVGAPYELPYTDTFAEDDTHVWTFSGEQGSAYFDRWGSYSSDGDDAALCFYVWGWEVEECNAVASTGKICTAADAVLTFDYKADTNAQLLIVMGNQNDEEGDLIPVTAEPLVFEAGSEGTITIPALFDQVLDRPYVNLAFLAVLDATYQYLFIDNLKIEVPADPTGITEVRNERAAQVYDLSGKQLTHRPAAGLFIQNGQKMMAK